MSFPKDLDEYDDDVLERELKRREQCRKRGDCDYCGRNWETVACKFPWRHGRPGINVNANDR